MISRPKTFSRLIARNMLIMILSASTVIAGCMWADDVTEEQNRYCSMVGEGAWPDYKNIFEKSCKGVLTQRFESVELQTSKANKLEG